MSTQTTNLQLVKPLESDFYDINVINGNMDKLDVAVAAKETPAGAQAKVDQHSADNTKHVLDNKLVDASGNELLIFNSTANAVNEITIQNNTSGAAPKLQATGNDANIDLNLVSKGAGTVQANGAQVATVSGVETLTNKILTSPKITSASSINDVNGNELIKFPAAVTGAVNEITVANAAAGTAPQLQASGNDANIDLNIVPKGTGTLKVNGAGVLLHNLATAANDFLVASAAGVFVKKTLAEVKSILGLGSAAYTASTAYATAAQGTKADNAATQTSVNAHIADNSKHIPHLGTTTNSGNNYSITSTEAISAGKKFSINFNVASTGAATLNISSIGSAKAIKKIGGFDAIIKIGVYNLFYDGTNFQLLGEGGEIAKLPNLIKNGSFENDLNCWMNEGAILTSGAYSGTKCLKTMSDANAISYVYTDISFPSGHKIFITGMFFLEAYTSGAVSSLYTYQYGTWTGVGGISVNTAVPNTWQRLSMIVTAENAGLRILVGRGGVGVESSRADAIMCFDLTEAYNGDLPSITELETLIQSNGGYWESPLKFFTSDTDASADDILMNKSAYSNDIRRVGTIPILSKDGYCEADLLSPYEGILYMHSQKGYFDGGANSWLYKYEPNYIKANIKKDINMFGLVGTLEQRLYASGEYVRASSGVITVSGLTFQPKAIIIHGANDVARDYTIYNVGGLGYDSAYNVARVYYNPDNIYKLSDHPEWYVNVSGFKLPVGESSGYYYWEAWA